MDLGSMVYLPVAIQRLGEAFRVGRQDDPVSLELLTVAGNNNVRERITIVVPKHMSEDMVDVSVDGLTL